MDETGRPQLAQQLIPRLQDRVHRRVADEVVAAEVVHGVIVGFFLKQDNK